MKINDRVIAYPGLLDWTGTVVEFGEYYIEGMGYVPYVDFQKDEDGKILMVNHNDLIPQKEVNNGNS